MKARLMRGISATFGLKGLESAVRYDSTSMNIKLTLIRFSERPFLYCKCELEFIVVQPQVGSISFIFMWQEII